MGRKSGFYRRKKALKAPDTGLETRTVHVLQEICGNRDLILAIEEKNLTLYYNNEFNKE